MFCAHTLITSSWCNLSLFPTNDPLSSPVSVSPACLSINFPFSQLTRLLPVNKHTPQQGSVDSHKKFPIRKLTLRILLYMYTYVKRAPGWDCRSKLQACTQAHIKHTLLTAHAYSHIAINFYLLWIDLLTTYQMYVY